MERAYPSSSSPPPSSFWKEAHRPPTNLSMLRYFFENLEAEENAKLFEGLEVSSKLEVMEQQGKYPVIYLTLKEAKQNSFEGVLNHLKGLLSEEYRRHEAILEAKILREEEEVLFQDMGIVIELKTRKQEDTKKEIEEALKQITRMAAPNRHYSAKLRARGIVKILGSIENQL